MLGMKGIVWTVALLLAVAVAGTAFGQLSDAEMKARMDALNKRAAERSAPTERTIPGQMTVTRWAARPNMPEAVHRFCENRDAAMLEAATKLRRSIRALRRDHAAPTATEPEKLRLRTRIGELIRQYNDVVKDRPDRPAEIGSFQADVGFGLQPMGTWFRQVPEGHLIEMGGGRYLSVTGRPAEGSVLCQSGRTIRFLDTATNQMEDVPVITAVELPRVLMLKPMTVPGPDEGDAGSLPDVATAVTAVTPAAENPLSGPDFGHAPADPLPPPTFEPDVPEAHETDPSQAAVAAARAELMTAEPLADGLTVFSSTEAVYVTVTIARSAEANDARRIGEAAIRAAWSAVADRPNANGVAGAGLFRYEVDVQVGTRTVALGTKPAEEGVIYWQRDGQ